MPALNPFVGAVSATSRRWRLPEAASLLASAGVPVFPCASGGKRPLTTHGFHDSTTDLGQVEQWWARMPSANIGIPTGAASGVVVVDVDVHGPVNGYEALQRAHRAGLVDGWELLVRSPSGGMHLYFPAASGVAQRSWQAARVGIDFRGEGGYIIVPPSLRDIDSHIVRYTVEKTHFGQSAPLNAERLRDFLAPRPVIKSRSSIATAELPVDIKQFAAWVARRQEGERNRGLFWAACTMAKHDVPAAEAQKVLTTAGDQAGLSPREVATTVRSAYRTIHGAPTSQPVRAAPSAVGLRSPPGSLPQSSRVLR